MSSIQSIYLSTNQTADHSLENNPDKEMIHEIFKESIQDKEVIETSSPPRTKDRVVELAVHEWKK